MSSSAADNSSCNLTITDTDVQRYGGFFPYRFLGFLTGTAVAVSVIGGFESDPTASGSILPVMLFVCFVRSTS